MERPLAGIHYPKSLGELRAWFPTDADCLDYLEWLRWPHGFVCPSCGHSEGWRLGDGRFKCTGCDSRTSVIAGTIFDRTRTPLTVWFSACWHFATGKDGISALSLKRTLEIGSYQTVWGGSFVPRRHGWTSRGRRLSFASMTSPGYAASSAAHRILWRPHPGRTRTPVWLHRASSGLPGNARVGRRFKAPF
jgi:Transposase zinc-ribbon domain